ncbi:MAG: hypothetical protein AAF738_04255 [Bacteroidota bacterium]
MQLKLIQQHISDYKKWLRTPQATHNLHKWESQQIFQEQWDMDSLKFAAMYDQSLQNSTTRRIWNRESYAPKHMMLEFAKMQPHFVEAMFRELFEETKDIGARVDRFVFYCDELLREYKQVHPTSIQNSHYHDDGYEMISHYLAFRFPEQYTPYRLDVFQAAMQKIGSRDIPRTNDFARYSKVMRTLMNFLQKEEELLELHQERLREEHYTGKSQLLVEDFVWFFTGM